MATAYQLLQSATTILRTADNAFIPTDPGNSDYQAYQAWVAAGNAPAAAVAAANPPTLRAADYMARFTSAEIAAWQAYILTGSTTGTAIVLSAKVGGPTWAWLWTVLIGDMVSLAATATSTAHAALVSAGILTQARSTAILTP